MARNDPHTQMLLGQIKEMLTSGMTQKEADETLGLTVYRPVHELLRRERIKEVKGVPQRRGCKPVSALQAYKYENKRL